MKIVDRIKLFIESRNISLRSFDESVGMSKGYMSRQIKTHASVGGDVLERIIDTYPELNPIWLLKGEGEMLLVPNNMANEDQPLYNAPDLMARALSIYMDHPEIVIKIRSMIDLYLHDKNNTTSNLNKK
ncbi:hypothetical protein [Ascidiimonas sp. W6]|uniref:hypothetical protein n=1 Tax=Ascidiimonas meishanensis TaxID=3128903 RepID=UPI0030EC225A